MSQVASITLAGGCFWCLEAVYQSVRGILTVESGYANGQTKNPQYEEVCGGQTGFAEVVRLTYDSQTISLEALLDIFFAMHDPTTLNRQGHDVGTQYRSGVYTQNDAQRAVALQRIQVIESERWYEQPIVTEVEPLLNFYPAESYHHNYYSRHPDQAYCSVVISPKLQKLRQAFAAHWQCADPILDRVA